MKHFNYFFIGLLCIACQISPITSIANNYPDHWWAPVPKEGAPLWEILPQEAGPDEVILSKRNELGILSNFAATPFEYKNKTYASLEGFWQMMKYPEGPEDLRLKNPKVTWPYTRDQVAAMTAFEAKKAGTIASDNMKTLGIDWVTFEGKKILYREQAKGNFYKLIYEAEWAKLRQNSRVSEILLKTGNLKLRPDHREEPNSPPAWHYYAIWMEIRTQLQSAK